MNKKDNNRIDLNADTYSLGAGLSIHSKDDIKKTITITNNRAHYFANQAKKYRDEAKIHCENAKQYAEANSNVTYEQLIDLRVVLESQINTKQDAGDYALTESIPVNVSELENDSNYVTESEMNTAVDNVLPDIPNDGQKFLATDGNTLDWVSIHRELMFALKPFDHVLTFEESKGYSMLGSWVYKEESAGTRYGYPDFYSKCLEEKAAGIEETITIGESSFTAYKNSNGHVFYDITQQSVVDSIYDATGAAWYYGIDEANERILLPRAEAGFLKGNDGEDNVDILPAYIYMIVGNTDFVGALTNVTEITTSENDTLPLFFYYCSEIVPNSPAFVESNGNYLSGCLYETAYNTLVNALNETSSLNLSVKTYESTDITDYDFVINQDNMTFRLPLKVVALQDNLENMNLKLYFKIANAVQNLELINATNVLNALNNKVDSTGNQTIIESYQDETSWYRIWSDGWIEQGGKITYPAARSKTTAVSFLKNFSNTNYNITSSPTATRGTTYGTSIIAKSNTGYTQFIYGHGSDDNQGTGFYWHVCGY